MTAVAKYSAEVARRALIMRSCGRSIAQISRKLRAPRSTVGKMLRFETPTRTPSKAELMTELVALLKQQGGPMTWAQYRAAAKHPGVLYRYWSSWSAFHADALGRAKVAETLPVREKQRYEDRITALGRQLKEAHREINAAEDVRRSIFKLADQPIDPPKWMVPAVPPKSKPGIPLLFGSDYQWGEEIRANELDGINAFNREIARARLKRMVERTVDLCRSHTVNPDYPGIIYARGGDMISGDIHQELRETNDLQSIPAVLDLVENEAAAIRVLVDKFGKVHVISVPGNHGRTTIKPHAKRFVETNYDYLIACMLEREFRADKRVTFYTPMSGDARFAVYGWWFLLTHGDRIGSSGGQGFIGPAATITRGMKKLVDYYTTLGQHVDWVLMGHFHTRLELEYGFSNGSLPGYSEFAKQFRMRPSPPEQWLFFVHPARGITTRWPIQLGPRPKLGHAGAPLPAVHIE
jgi:hypothetical protein